MLVRFTGLLLFSLALPHRRRSLPMGTRRFSARGHLRRHAHRAGRASITWRLMGSFTSSTEAPAQPSCTARSRFARRQTAPDYLARRTAMSATTRRLDTSACTPVAGDQSLLSQQCLSLSLGRQSRCPTLHHLLSWADRSRYPLVDRSMRQSLAQAKESWALPRCILSALAWLHLARPRPIC